MISPTTKSHPSHTDDGEPCHQRADTESMLTFADSSSVAWLCWNLWIDAFFNPRATALAATFDQWVS